MSATMSTFVLPNSVPEVQVKLTPDLSKDQLLSFPAFKNWVSTLQKSLSSQQQNERHTFHSAPYKLRRIDVQAVDFFGEDRIGFVKLKAEVSNDEGEKFPGSVFLRGGSVGMLLILQPDDVPSASEAEKHVIMTVQPRIPAGSLAFAELPAGMLDDESGTFAGGAAREIEEETGLKVSENELINLTELAVLSREFARSGSERNDRGGETEGEGEDSLQRAMYPSPGGSDEFVPLFFHQKRVPRDQLKEWQGKLTGLRDHGEKITLKLVPLGELWREGVRDAKALAALALYDGLRKEGKL